MRLGVRVQSLHASPTHLQSVALAQVLTHLIHGSPQCLGLDLHSSQPHLHLVYLRQYRLDGRTGLVAVLVLVVFCDWFVHSTVYTQKDSI